MTAPTTPPTSMCDVQSPLRRRSFSRPRSPIPRIKQLFSLKNPPSSFHFPPAQPSGYTIPIEIITKVGHYTTSLGDVLSMSLTCRRARSALLPRLYKTIELKTNRHCKATLELLAKYPEYTQHVRSLHVSPNNVERTAAGNYSDEAIIAKLIIKIATRMPILQSFSWDGLEMPDDRIWQVLRQFCPLLKSISTSVGFLPIKSSDSLFDFHNLIKFSFIVKSDSLDWLSDGTPRVEKLPRRFWQMIIEYCPNLQELTIGGPAPSPRLFDTRHVTAGRWPRLRSLTLGDMRLQSSSDPDDMTTPESQALSKFLIAHPKLTNVAVLHPGGSGFPSNLLLPPTTLPHMHTFSGPLRYIRCLPNPAQIKHLSITTLHHCLSAFPPTYAMLKTLPSLVSLAIWIDLSFANRSVVQDDGSIFRTLLECCPKLVHLDLYCFTRPNFHVKEFSAALRRSPCLRSFSLTKIHKTSDEDMIHTATRIAHNNPSIQNFTLRYTPESWLTHRTGHVKQFGEYEILRCGDDGLPTALVAYEWGFKSFGNTFSHHYVHNLKPPKMSRRGSGSSRLSWSSTERFPRPQSVLSFNSFQFAVK